MNTVAALSLLALLFSCPTVLGQDAMQYGAKHLTVLAEDLAAGAIVTIDDGGMRVRRLPIG